MTRVLSIVALIALAGCSRPADQANEERVAELEREVLELHVEVAELRVAVDTLSTESSPTASCDVSSSDYTRCIIRTLEGHAGRARELNQLIAAYRQIGDQDAAFRHMQTFVRRFPNHARSQGYGQILAAHDIEIAERTGVYEEW